MTLLSLRVNGLVNWRFALSPVHATMELMLFRTAAPHVLPRRWVAATSNAIGDRRLRLLTRVVRDSACGYIPDFLTPEPASFAADADDELHQVAVTPAARLAYEVSRSIDGAPVKKVPTAASQDQRVLPGPPAWLLRALDQGETQFAEDLAGQLAYAWHTLIEPSWPELRSQLEADITYRARRLAQDGLTGMLAGLDRALHPVPGGLAVEMNTKAGDFDAVYADSDVGETVILMPAAFGHRPLFTMDPATAPDRRATVIAYPSIANTPADVTRFGELIGVTRADILAELQTPRSTDQLALRLHLSSSTVSYHLQILLRTGLAHRVRDGRRVYYHAADPVPDGAARGLPLVGPDKA